MGDVLLKTEPGEYSFADLVREKQAAWDGVSNAQALANLRRVRKGDRALIYHTGDEKAIVGLAEVTADPVEDPGAPGLTAEGLPKTPRVMVRAITAAARPLTLAAMKDDARFAGWALLKQGRLSVVPVPADVMKVIVSLTGL